VPAPIPLTREGVENSKALVPRPAGMARRNRSTLLRTIRVQHRRHGVARRIVIISDDTRAMGRRVRCGNIALEIRENTETRGPPEINRAG
jgi:hypothetical protein